MSTQRTVVLTPFGAESDPVEFTVLLEDGRFVRDRYEAWYGKARRSGGPWFPCFFKSAAGTYGVRALSTEVAVYSGLRLADRDTGRFGELIGFDLREDRTARLLRTRDGQFPEPHRKALTSARLRQPAEDLFTALHALASNGYALRRLTAETVFLDGGRLQLADLSTVAVKAEPDQLAADVRAAAGLLFTLASGQRSLLGSDDPRADPRPELDWLATHHRDLAMLLEPVYRAPATPTTGDLLLRLGAWPEHDPDGGPVTLPDYAPRPTAPSPRPPQAPRRPDAPASSPAPGVPDHVDRHFEDGWATGRRPLARSRPPEPARQPPAPAGGRPRLPDGFPFLIDERGNRRPHPAVLWPALFVLVVLILLVAL